MTKSIEKSEKCSKCKIGEYINNEMKSTRWKSVFICNNCQHKITKPKQTCANCREGMYVRSEAHSTVWEDTYICDNCGNIITTPTFWSNVKEFSKILRDISDTIKTLPDILDAIKGVPDIIKKSLSDKGKDYYEFYSQIDVKIEYISDFITVSKQNRDASRLETGNMKYDIYQSKNDPTKFIFHEIYESQYAANISHKATSHYKRWKQDVEPMMAKARTRQNTGIPPGYKLIE